MRTKNNSKCNIKNNNKYNIIFTIRIILKVFQHGIYFIIVTCVCLLFLFFLFFRTFFLDFNARFQYQNFYFICLSAKIPKKVNDTINAREDEQCRRDNDLAQPCSRVWNEWMMSPSAQIEDVNGTGVNSTVI